MEKQERLQHLQYIREYELQQAVKFFPTKGKVLEIGAGSGWQAQRLTEYGYEVIAIDVSNSQYSQSRVFPIILYDGTSLPFSDNSFDIVFSSNVLEHVSEPVKLNKEVRRVLRRNGTAIHIVPTSVWRFWTLVTHHIYISRLIANFLRNRILTLDKEFNNRYRRSSHLSNLDILGSIFFPHRHGEQGTAIHELYFFSRRYWSRYFINHGWSIKSCYRMGLFYTGNQIFYSSLKLYMRKIFANYLGSSTILFVLK